jgi:hypothetical protein
LSGNGDARSVFNEIMKARTPLLYIHSSGWTDADLVRHIWPVRLIQPEWVNSPPQYDYLRWIQAETLARLSVVFIAWIASVGWIIRISRHRQPITSPNKAGADNGAAALSFHVALGRAVPDLVR